MLATISTIAAHPKDASTSFAGGLCAYTESRCCKQQAARLRILKPCRSVQGNACLACHACHVTHIITFYNSCRPPAHLLPAVCPAAALSSHPAPAQHSTHVKFTWNSPAQPTPAQQHRPYHNKIGCVTVSMFSTAAYAKARRQVTFGLLHNIAVTPHPCVMWWGELQLTTAKNNVWTFGQTSGPPHMCDCWTTLPPSLLSADPCHTRCGRHPC